MVPAMAGRFETAGARRRGSWHALLCQTKPAGDMHGAFTFPRSRPRRAAFERGAYTGRGERATAAEGGETR